MTTIDPKSHPETYSWVTKIAQELTPKHAGKFVVECTEVEGETVFYGNVLPTSDYHMEIYEVVAPPNTFLGNLFGKSQKHLVFQVLTPDSEFVRMTGAVPHNGNNDDYPELKAIVEKHSPYFKAEKTKKHKK